MNLNFMFTCAACGEEVFTNTLVGHVREGDLSFVCRKCKEENL